MSSQVSELIYNKFFEKLLGNKDIKPETIEAIKELYKSGKITNKNELIKLIQSMEERHDKDQTTNGQ
jgi:hypothetical protein